MQFLYEVTFLETSNGRLPPEHGSDRRETWPKHVSEDSRHFIFRRRKKIANFERPFTPRRWLRSAWNFGKTRFRRFPTFNFSTPQTTFRQFVVKKSSGWFCFQENGVLEELWFFGRDGQMRLDKWPPKFWLSALYDFSQRGKSGTYRFWSGFWTDKDFNHLVLWCYDHMIRRYYKIYGWFFFKKVAFWRSYGFLDVIGRCALKNDPRSFDLQLSTIFGREG